jgi:hypothetical protein
MIDTIILTLPRDKAMMLDLTGRGVDRWNLQARTKTYEKFVKNPSTKDAESGLYFPRLTGFRRAEGKLAWQQTIKIEFSAPKLLYKNNLDELKDGDFERVLETLDDRLKQMGVAFPVDALRNASVSAVHYSKNIELTDGYTSQYVIGELAKVDANRRFDLTRARYMNDGQSLYLYTIAHSFVLYDKIADLAKGKKRAIDKDQTQYQMSLFKELKREKEILRLEVRLSQKRKMNSLFKQLGFAENPTFRDVFSKAKSKKVVNHYWDTMVAGHSIPLFSHAYTPKDLLKRVLVARRGAKGKTAVYLTGLLFLARDENGLRELRSILGKHNDDRTWYRLAADLRGIAADLHKMRPREWYGQVKKALTSYQLGQVACK